MKTFIDRHPGWFVTLLIVAVPFFLFLVLFQLSMFVTAGFWIGMLWLLIQVGVFGVPLGFPAFRNRQQRQRTRQTEVLARADYEHQAMMRGDLRTGVFGQFPPNV